MSFYSFIIFSYTYNSGVFIAGWNGYHGMENFFILFLAATPGTLRHSFLTFKRHTRDLMVRTTVESLIITKKVCLKCVLLTTTT